MKIGYWTFVPCFKTQSWSVCKFNNLPCENPQCFSAGRFLFAARLQLSFTVLFDLAIWARCAAALLAFACLSATHPATPYLLFHGRFIAVRSVAILNSASTLFSWPGGDPVSADEILRAVLFVDVALVAKTCAQILAAHRTAGHGESQIHFANAAAGDITHQRVAAFAIVVGAIALLLWSKIPGLDA